MSNLREIAADQKIVTFVIKKQLFGIDMDKLVEIREWVQPTMLPGAPAYIKGVTNLRGRVLPVVDLAERLGWAATVPHPRSCVLVVNVGNEQAAFLVDEIADIMPTASKSILPAPDVGIREADAVLGLIEVSGRTAEEDGRGRPMVLFLDLEALNVTGSVALAA